MTTYTKPVAATHSRAKPALKPANRPTSIRPNTPINYKRRGGNQ